MKFKFCGENDCQDWILTQINVCSKLTSIKLKLILKEVIQHILTGNLNNTCKLTSDAKLDEEETKAVLAALNYIILSSVKYNTDNETVSNELQQLGFPREHSTALSKVYSENFDKIKQIIKEKSLRLNTLTEYSYEIVSRFEHETCAIHCPSLILTMKATNDNNTYDRLSEHSAKSATFYMMPEKLSCLITDLKEVLQLMNELNEC